MEEELYARLIGLATVFGGRIYPMVAPENAVVPFAVYQIISMVPAQGAMDAESDIESDRVQIDSYGATYTQARAGGQAVRAALRNWKKDTGSIRDVIFENGRNIRESDPALKLFRVSQDYFVTFIQ
jgi:hypothetical protein